MGGVAMVLRLSPDPLESGPHATYPMRVSGTHGERDRLWVHGIPREVWAERDYEDMQRRLRQYVDDRMHEELERAVAPSGYLERASRNGGTERIAVRTHYTFVLTFDRDATDERVRSMADEWQERVFGPDRRTITAIHRDSDNVHAHGWVDARLSGGRPWTNGAKVRIPSQTYAREAWAEIYGREFGDELAREYVAKAREKTAARYAFKRFHEAREAAHERGESFDLRPPPLPARVVLSAARRDESERDRTAERTEDMTRDASTQSRDLEGTARGDRRSPAHGSDEGARPRDVARGRGADGPCADRDARGGERGAHVGGHDARRGVEAARGGSVGPQAQALAARVRDVAKTTRAAVDELARASRDLDGRELAGREIERGIER